ncbi:cyclase family protein [Amycolatopsis sp. NPDC006131]|uniref:cyclase family protein n=1 Tax=Amycolatopsis sp. NPDC006131 TaxID=3156731 RepID=UPI0033BA3BD8
MNRLPDYDQLPPGPHGGRLGWGLFGAGDDLGLVNLLTPERVAEAAKLVRRGVGFSLDVPHGTFAPPLNSARGNPRHHVIAQPGGIGFDDVWDNVYPQAGSQWDSLAHIGYTREVYYNGATAEDIRAGRRNTVDGWARHGIAGRGVLLDIPATMRELGRDYDPGETVELGVAELEAARELSGVDYRTGDILLIHTGFGSWYRDAPPEVRKALPRGLRAPGLEHSEDVCRYLWNAHVAAVASDTFAVEAWPADTSEARQPFGFIHQMLIGSFGMALGELWWLADLAADCAETGVYEGFLVSAPTQAPGGIASAANAVLFK